MKIQCILKYDCIIFNDEKRVERWLKRNDIKLLHTEIDKEDNLYSFYCLNADKEMVCVEAYIGWYIWIDDVGEINSASEDEVKENYRIFYDEESKGKIIKMNRSTK